MRLMNFSEIRERCHVSYEDYRENKHQISTNYTLRTENSECVHVYPKMFVVAFSDSNKLLNLRFTK